jgi:3-hydroxyisobutyrate dehydrogenase-like beta-hydroxyacid dehydrogenase
MVTDAATGATNAPTVGFLGLGIMGTAMCRNLLKCGAFSKVVVWNRTASKVGSATTLLQRYNANRDQDAGSHTPT